jgi:hypothetical protein
MLSMHTLSPGISTEGPDGRNWGKFKSLLCHKVLPSMIDRDDGAKMHNTYITHSQNKSMDCLVWKKRRPKRPSGLTSTAILQLFSRQAEDGDENEV